MSTVMTTGVMPDHRERSAAVRSRGVSSTITGERVETTVPSPEKKDLDTDPHHERVVDMSQPTYSPELGRNLIEMKTSEQTKRDFVREQKKLADIRALQTAD